MIPARCSGCSSRSREHGINMTRIESRPSRKRKWDYVFFMDVEGHVSDPPLAQGAGFARGTRLAVQGARLLSAGGAMTVPASAASRLTKSIEARPARRVSGRVMVPGDKSISHRAILLSALASGESEVRGFLASEDCLASLAAMRALGVRIEQPQPARVRVQGVGLHGLKAAAHALDMGNAGTAMRLFAGLLAAQSFDSTADRR